MKSVFCNSVWPIVVSIYAHFPQEDWKKECYISRLLICTKMKFFVKKTAYSITVINVQKWNSTWRRQLTQSRSQLCLQIFGFSVRHTYIFGDFNQIKQFNTRSLMNSDNSYFGFRYVQVYLCLCDGSSAIWVCLNYLVKYIGFLQSIIYVW